MASNWDAKAGLIDAKTPKYSWTQTVEEVQLSIKVNPGTRARDISVEIKEKTLKVSLKNTKEIIIDGTLFGTVKPKDSIWTLDSNTRELI